MPRLEICDILVLDISLDISRRLNVFIIHKYLYYFIFIFLFIPISISIMITDPFCRYSYTYLCWNYCVYCVYSMYWDLASTCESIFTMRMYITVASPVSTRSGGYNIRRWWETLMLMLKLRTCSSAHCLLDLKEVKSEYEFRISWKQIQLRIIIQLISKIKTNYF